MLAATSKARCWLRLQRILEDIDPAPLEITNQEDIQPYPMGVFLKATSARRHHLEIRWCYNIIQPHLKILRSFYSHLYPNSSLKERCPSSDILVTPTLYALHCIIIFIHISHQIGHSMKTVSTFYSLLYKQCLAQEWQCSINVYTLKRKMLHKDRVPQCPLWAPVLQPLTWYQINTKTISTSGDKGPCPINA